ncbi:MAG: hypothetical protein ACPLYF_03340 [Fervidobacterium sp.]
MAKTVRIRVYLTPRQKQILEKLCQTLGTNESEALRLALVNYAAKLNLLEDQGKHNIK